MYQMDFGKLLTIIVACLCCAHAANEQCIEGRYHKDSPSAETDEYKVCTPWKSLTCCTPQFDNELDKNEARNLYNHSWHRCGNLSKECLRFWKRQECFYQCSPFAYKWQHINVSEAIEGVPICASECDDWFEACKNDSICVENVLTDYNFTMFGENFCPVDAMCKNYSEMYGNGKALCEKMWGSSYKYTEQNANKDNCMVFWFTPDTENPNRRVNNTRAEYEMEVNSKPTKYQENVNGTQTDNKKQINSTPTDLLKKVNSTPTEQQNNNYSRSHPVSSSAFLIFSVFILVFKKMI